MAKVFNDPIHGHIELHPVLVKIINTPEFQRLRNIKQLGGVYFVYPGASHNRFEHSIGVGHLAGELAKALKVKQLERIKPLEELKKLKKLKELKELTEEQLETLKTADMLTSEDWENLEKLKSEESEEFKKLKEFNPEDLKELEKSLISDRDVLCVQIAGLCHDLGHGPFSHLFDRMFMPEADKGGKKWEHEDASVDMFLHLLEKTDGLKEMMKKCGLKIEGDDKTDLVFIEELIKGPPKDKAKKDKAQWKYKGRDETKSFLYEIVSNKETGIDVDKFDYFARDCHHLGIQNNFDHKRFIMFARVCDVEEDGRKHICSRDKEVANLYDIFQQRHSIHRRACKHKIAVAVEMMVKDALVLADEDPYIQIETSNGKKFRLSKAKENMEAYIKLTDQVIERILNSCSPSLKEAREILRRVMERDLYRCVGQAREKKEPNEEEEKKRKEKMKEELRRQLVESFSEGGEKNFEIIDVTFDYGMKTKDPISNAYFYRKDNPDKGIPISKSKVSKLLPEHFSDEKLMVYWKNYEKAQEEKKEKKEKKIKEFFKTWCDENGFEAVEEEDDTGTSAPSPATPGNDQSI